MVTDIFILQRLIDTSDNLSDKDLKEINDKIEGNDILIEEV